MSVSQDTIQKIKALPVSSVLAAEGIELRRVGREYITKCLWHRDKNPSLTISDDKGFVFCHVCQQHNDAIGFIKQKYGISFRDACLKIAANHNIQCIFVDENSEEYKFKKLAIDKQQEQTQSRQEFFRDNLRKSSEAIHFIRQREILPESSREFQLGYNINDTRITIPIHNHLGQLVGFTARGISDNVKPKYKNTENNLIFNKSEIVFNEYKASAFIREADECIFVEGHLDVISMWQNGIKNVVALQGTASPSETILKRLLVKTRRFVLCMDGDEGGRSAVYKFLDTVQKYTLTGELEVRIVCLPEGEDPDSLIKKGGDLKSLILNSPSWMDWILDVWLDQIDFNDKLKVQNIETKIKELFSKIASPALRAYYYDKASIRLAQNKQSIAAEIAKSFHEYQSTNSESTGWSKPPFEYTRRLVERRLLRVYLHRKDFRFVLEPLTENLIYPETIWLWQRIKEIKDLTDENLLIDIVKAITCVAEPNYVQKVRSILTPSFHIFDDELSIAHMEDIMSKSMLSSGNIE